MSTVKSTSVKERFIDSFLSTNRVYNVISFLFGFIIAHCTDFVCVVESFKAIIRL